MTANELLAEIAAHLDQVAPETLPATWHGSLWLKLETDDGKDGAYTVQLSGPLGVDCHPELSR